MNTVAIVTNFNVIQGQHIGVKCDYGPIKIWSNQEQKFINYAPAYKSNGNLFKIPPKFKQEDIDITQVIEINDYNYN